MAVDIRSADAQELLITYDQLLSRQPNDFDAAELILIQRNRARLARQIFEQASFDFDDLDIP